MILAENVFDFEPATIKCQTIATTATGMIYVSLPHSKLMVDEEVATGSLRRKSNAHTLTIRQCWIRLSWISSARPISGKTSSISRRHSKRWWYAA